MGSCPFCHSEIEEDLIRLGGQCPSCFAYIPGEEAPTDPGETVRKHQEKADARAAGTARRWIPAVLAPVLLLSILCVAVGIVLGRPKPVAVVLDFDDLEGYPEIPLVAIPEPEPVVAAAPKTRPRPKPAPGDVAVAELSTDAEGLPGDREIRIGDAPAPAPTAAPGGAPSFDLGGVGVKRKPPRLTDDEAIISHIYEVMTAGARDVRRCYDLRLKTDESLSGTWQIDYTVGREGNVTAVKVTGLDRADADLEACIGREVAEWGFYPIRADQPVTKRFNLRPGF